MPCSMWDMSSLTRNWNPYPLLWDSEALTTWLPGVSHLALVSAFIDYLELFYSSFGAHRSLPYKSVIEEPWNAPILLISLRKSPPQLLFPSSMVFLTWLTILRRKRKSLFRSWPGPFAIYPRLSLWPLYPWNLSLVMHLESSLWAPGLNFAHYSESGFTLNFKSEVLCPPTMTHIFPLNDYTGPNLSSVWQFSILSVHPE